MALTVPWRAPAKTEAAVTASVAVSAPQAGMGSTVRSQVRLAQGCRGFPSPTLTWALAPSSPVTGRAIGYWSCQLVQQDPLPAEIASRSLKTRTLQGQYLVWHPGIICAESVAEPACGVGIRAGSQHPSPFPWHHSLAASGSKERCLGGSRASPNTDFCVPDRFPQIIQLASELEFNLGSEPIISCVAIGNPLPTRDSVELRKADGTVLKVLPRAPAPPPPPWCQLPQEHLGLLGSFRVMGAEPGPERRG